VRIVIDGAEVYGTVEHVGPVLSIIATPNGNALALTTKLIEWNPPKPDTILVGSGLFEFAKAMSRASTEIPSSAACPIHGADCAAWA